MIDYKKESNKDQLNTYIDYVLEKLHAYLNDNLHTNQRKVALICYRLNSYTNFLKQEETFKPNFQPVYKHGSVILVDFGFRLGNEQGGLHYAIVLDKYDSKRQPVLTVLPLSSTKPNKKFRNTEVDLGNEIYNLIENKITTIINNTKNTLEKLNKDSNLDNQISNIPEIVRSMELEIKIAEDCNKKIHVLKEGSYAITNQIVTISKMRIKEPTKDDQPLYNIILSKDNMESISNIIAKRYLDI